LESRFEKDISIYMRPQEGLIEVIIISSGHGSNDVYEYQNKDLYSIRPPK
jgi:hypothetical protein